MSLELRSVSVHRDGRTLLDHVDLSVADGERVALLGPSGSGKTTLLRVVAGLTPVDEGRVVIGGSDVTRTPPRDRDLAMVDQEASLQPHLDVRDNVAFPLRLRRTDRREIHRRVEAETRASSLRGLLHRRPHQLSGGQRHDVALARSLVRRVGLLLYDEPFARTDPPRRAELVRALLTLQDGSGVTLLVATNDQLVGLRLAQRCAVLVGGRLLQIGGVTELFDRPADRSVAGLVGDPPMNLVPGRVERARSGVRIVAGPLRIPSFVPAISDLAGQPCTVGVRPTDLRRDVGRQVVTLEEVVRRAVDLGSVVDVTVGTADEELVARLGRPAPVVGGLLRLAVDPARVHLFDARGAAVAHGV